MRNRFDVRNADFDTLKAPEYRPVTIVSADSHASLPAMLYEKYLDPNYRESLDDQLRRDIEVAKMVPTLMGYPLEEEALELIDPRGVMSAAGEVGCFDPVWRLRQVEAEGVVAEFLHPIGPIGFVPFADMANSPRSHELRAAGSRAHNRFLEDFCSEAPGRLLGVPLIYPWPDWDAGVADCVRAREAGFYAIYPPFFAGVDGDLPPLSSPWWDPMWAACQDNGLVVHIHAGFGSPQGVVGQLVGNLSATGFNEEQDHQDAVIDQVFENDALETFMERRPLWQLMWAGVFDRFPRLKVAFMEIHGDWVPPTLAYLDRMHSADPGPLKLTPSEYWHRHCAVGASLMRYGDVAARHEIGLDRLMFATDFPHIESTWPNTHDYIRATMDSIPVEEARAILGENAIEFYGLDRALLEKTAKRIGPLPGEILGGGHHVDPAIIRHFEWRTGIDKPVSFDERRTNEAFMQDRDAALSASSATSRQ